MPRHSLSADRLALFDWSIIEAMFPRVLAVALVLGVVAACGGGDDQGPAASAAASSATEAFVVSVDDRADSLGETAGVDVEEIARAAAAKVFAVLPEQEQVSISIAVDAKRATPDVGVGGFTDPIAGDIGIWLDDTPTTPLAEVFETWLPATIAHEAHHASRIQVGPGYGQSLAQAIVTEGLADRFVLEVFPDSPVAPWSDALDDAQRAEVWERALPQLHGGFYDHDLWFFGTGDVPYWAGYSIGFDAVGRYLEANGLAPSRLIDVSANEILAEYDPAQPAVARSQVPMGSG